MSLNTNVQGKKFSPLTLSLSDFLVQQLDQLGHFLTKHKEKDTLPTLTSSFSEALTARSRIVIAQTRPTSPLAENGDCIRIQIWHFQWSVDYDGQCGTLKGAPRFVAIFFLSRYTGGTCQYQNQTTQIHWTGNFTTF